MARFSIHDSLQTQFLNGEPSDVKNYACGKEELSKPEKIFINFEDIKNDGPFIFKYSEDFATSDVFTIDTSNKKVAIINPKIATTYFYKIYHGSTELRSDKFIVGDEIIILSSIIVVSGLIALV